MAKLYQRFSYRATGLMKLSADLQKRITVPLPLEGSTTASMRDLSFPPREIWEHLCDHENDECTNILEEKNLEDFPDWLYFQRH